MVKKIENFYFRSSKYDFVTASDRRSLYSSQHSFSYSSPSRTLLAKQLTKNSGLLCALPLLTASLLESPQQTFENQLKKLFGSELSVVKQVGLEPVQTVLSREFMLARGYETGAPPLFEKGANRVFRFDGNYQLFGSLMERIESFAPQNMVQWLSDSQADVQTDWFFMGENKFLNVYHKGMITKYSFLLDPVRIEYSDEPWNGTGNVRLILHYRRIENSISWKQRNNPDFEPNLFGSVVYEFGVSQPVKDASGNEKPILISVDRVALNLFMPGNDGITGFVKNHVSEKRIQNNIRKTYHRFVMARHLDYLKRFSRQSSGTSQNN